MLKSNRKVSVIMPTYNVASFVDRSVISILEQRFENFELIIIDDGSTDGTTKVLRSFEDPRVRFFSRPHMGTVYQLNFGLSKVSGEYIARQDGDDYSDPERFERQVQFLDTHPDYGVVSSSMALIDEWGNPLGVLHYPREPDHEKLMEKCCISHAASMWRKQIHDIVGGYDEQFNKNCCEDYDLWLRVVERFRIYVLADVLYTKRERPESSIGRTRWTYVPIYDELARTKAMARRL